jgi:hypothetical protein
MTALDEESSLFVSFVVGSGCVVVVVAAGGGPSSPMYPDSRSTRSLGLAIFNRRSISVMVSWDFRCFSTIFWRVSVARFKSFCTKKASSPSPLASSLASLDASDET